MNKTIKNIITISLFGILLLGPCFALIPNWLVQNFELKLAAILQMCSFLIVLSVAAATSLVIIKKQNISIKSIGLFKSSPWYANLTGITTGLLWAGFSIFSLKGMDPGADIAGMWLRFDLLRIIMIIMGPIGACIEDFIIRGFFICQLKELKVPKVLQLAFSALLFAVYHSIWMIPLIGLYFLYGFISSFFYGLLLSGLFFLGRRSLTPVMLSHGITVFLGEPILTYVLLKSFMF